MNARIAGRVDGWTSRPFSDGFADLRDLADEEFSGVVEADAGPWLCMLNGKVVGVFEGRMDDFKDASGTTFVAPDPAVPLLFAMQERGGTLEEQYYTKDTPISEADRTLSSGSFVGYIELSENILSGDYYVCYYGGRSMPVAFVGNSDQLVTGDEAFEKADDEVGIYDVFSVDMDVVEIPGGEPRADAAAVGTGESGGEPVSGDGGGASPTDDDPGVADASGHGATIDEGQAGHEATIDDDPPAGSSAGTPPGERSDPPPHGAGSDPPAEEPAPGGDAGTEEPPGGPYEGGYDAGSTDVGGDPDETPYGDDVGVTDGPDRSGGTTRSEPAGPGDRTTDRGEDRPAGTPTGTPPGERSGAGTGGPGRPGEVDAGAIDRVRDRVRSHEETIEVLKDQIQVAKRQHDQFEDEHDRRDELIEQLRETVGVLESDLQDLYRRVDRMDERLAAIDRIEDRLDELSGAPAPEPDETDRPASPAPEPAAGGAELSAGEALRETNLLVRYDSKGKPTLESAHRGDADRGPVNDNLRLDTHTSFVERDATVEGQPFDAFLRGRIEYEFAEWLVRDLPYEIRDTGNADALGDLYDAMPEIDRIEMNAEVEVPVDEESDESETVTFDVVVRDKSGRPLVVANFNDSRDPATREMVVDLEESARKLRAASDLRAALLVTKSYFAPEALETVEQATGGSLLSRDSKKSYVKLNRKRGYHLCLVESRDGDFHLNVPEL